MNDAPGPAPTTPKNRIALLIDAENISATAYDAIASQLAQRGQVISRYIFGQWPRLSHQWREITLAHLLHRIPTLSVGQKNGADIALTIHAMDILHRREADAVAIASSDADFTQLAIRLRQAGLAVFGLGISSKATPEWVAACTEFVGLESEPATTVASPTSAKDKAQSKVKAVKADGTVSPQLTALLQQALTEDNQVLSALGTKMRKLDPQFESKKYGFKRLTDLVTAQKNLLKTTGSGNALRVRLISGISL